MPVQPFKPIANAAQVVIQSRLDGEACYSTFGFVRTAPTTVTQAMVQALVSGLASIFVANFMPELPALYVFGKAVARALDVEDSWQAEDAADAGTVGSLPGAILPNNCSLATAFQTGLAGRSKRGRQYWPSFLEGEVLNQRVDAAKIAQILVLYEFLIGDDIVAPGWRWAVLSRKVISGVWEGHAYPITKVLFNDAVIDSMRRRLPGRGA